MEYNSDSKSKPMILDGKGNVDALLATIKEVTGLTLYASSETMVIDILNNPKNYLSNSDDINKLNELKLFIDYKGEYL